VQRETSYHLVAIVYHVRAYGNGGTYNVMSQLTIDTMVHYHGTRVPWYHLVPWYSQRVRTAVYVYVYVRTYVQIRTYVHVYQMVHVYVPWYVAPECLYFKLFLR
jgi:hypothetical protein